ncbi:ATP-binding protein [Herbidospora sp. NBRC 101105]|uniref:ATP-binding protein n=1 Tax=Herbidospora sp. NBRC 101105 TaxID=3032195 RepID=UPI0024A3A841|nr:ATP-binding protein [Herbidospora sp. NBRC 101105]GLX95264.1 hypothetical protein Hesp01_32140 [Herbidospora sp. NBRC 101105]
MAHPLSSKPARAYVRAMVMALGRDDLVGVCELVASELVANAITATREAASTGVDGSAGSDGPGTIGVGVYQDRRAIVIEVWDCSRMPPRMVEPADDTEGGRGLVLVGALSSDWSYRRPVSGGKVVYARIEAAL